MVSGFICGSSRLPREDDDYGRQTRSADSSPARSRSKSGCDKNPYSSRGLDKFSALLAEIDVKRQQIYSQVDPDEISLVRFAYSGDHDFKPIVVVKAKPKSPTSHAAKQSKQPDSIDRKLTPPRKLRSSKSMNVKEENKAENEANKKTKKLGICKYLKDYQLKGPKLLLPVIVILILAFLVLFGRSFAIMCTSIGWYVIPTIITNNSNPSSNMKIPSKKKDYAVQRLSHKGLSPLRPLVNDTNVEIGTQRIEKCG